jgi:predicted metalloprotease with PDZ domain
MAKHRGRFPDILLAGTLFFSALARADLAPVQLEVDATDAPHQLLHTRLHIPAAPGPLTLYYPKWMPGEHLPGGPVNDVTGLEFSARGKPLSWQRDPVDMFAFHLEVPPGAAAVDVAFDFLLAAGGGVYSAGGSSTARLLDLNWNQVLLYPRNAAPLEIPFRATLKLPAGWKFGTALPLAGSSPDHLLFATVPLETLIDSPVIGGEFLYTVALTPGEKTPHFIHVAADNATDLAGIPPDVDHYPHLIRLVHEENALFGAHHYRDYHFLLTASDHVAHFGLEHHESSDDRVDASYLTDADTRTADAELLPHEMFHSWNGKYRRPAGLATPDYQQPMQAELLWVYEGLTSYYGKVLATRSGLQDAGAFRETLALNAAMLDHRNGRQWRSLADTTVAAQLLYQSPGPGSSRRRSVDFYSEGDLIWLEADALIRQQTRGARSLDDFCKSFYGGADSAPRVVPYHYDDVVRALNDLAPSDWQGFFQKRVYEVTKRAPLGGIENCGWRLAWTNAVPPLLKIREGLRKNTSLDYSLGFTLGTGDGQIGDVEPGSPADRAGIIQGMKLVAVNGRAWSATLLRAAVAAAATNRAPMTLLTVNDDYYQTFAVDYHGGEKYPVLERDSIKPDLLADIIKPLAAQPEPATNAPATK